MLTPREKDLSPRFGKAGRDPRDHLAQSIKASNRHRLEKPGGGERGLTSAAACESSRCSTPMLTTQRREARGGCELLGHIAPSGTSGRSLPQKPSGNAAVPPAALTTLPCRFPTCFLWNRYIPQETVLGIVYDFLFLTQKHLTRFLNTKYKTTNKQTKSNQIKLFGYSVDRIKGHGQAPHCHKPLTQPLHPSRWCHVGHLAEVHLTRSAAAGLPVLQLQ